MSARSRLYPWFRRPFVRYREWRAACSHWLHGDGNTSWMWAAGRPATTADIPEGRVQQVLGARRSAPEAEVTDVNGR